MLEDIFKETKVKMNASLQAVEKQLSTIRTGKASISILDGIRVNAYNMDMPLNQVATLSTPEPSLILIQPWDVSQIQEIEKAILKSDLGLNPRSDGRLIRLPIPSLSEERRKELAKKISHIGEEGKTSVRNIRRDSNDLIKELKSGKEISEDEEHRGLDEVQKITDDHIKQVEDRIEKKRKEIMTV
jgi:ribosome recycling factor